MRSLLLSLCLLPVVLLGCRGSDVLTDSAAIEQPATANVVPEGTVMELSLNDRLGTEISRVGETFTATVADPVTAETGNVAVPAGATVYGTVTGIDESDNIGDQAAIRLDFDRLEAGGQSYDFSADILETGVETDRDDDIIGEETAIGAGAGAALGLILEGDLLGTLIGGALGAGAGTAVSLGTGDVDAVLPAGTGMTVQTTQRIDLR
jgi:hypothetical protein